MEMKSPPLQKKRGTTQAPHGSLGGPSSSSSSDPPLDLVSGLSPTRSPPKTKKNRRVEYIDWYKWANDQLERIKMVLNNTDESTDTIRLDKIRKIVIDADAATPPGSSLLLAPRSSCSAAALRFKSMRNATAGGWRVTAAHG